MTLRGGVGEAAGEREGEKRRRKGFVVGFGVMDPKIAITEVRSSRLDTA